jgi:uncharacterized membrane protein (DUF485 family)
MFTLREPGKARDVKTATKAGIVIAGYVCALAIGFVAAWMQNLATANAPDAAASSGMYAFGEFMVFVFAFGFASLVPSGLAFYFLRENRTFWSAVALLAGVLASTNVIAAAFYWVAKVWPDSQVVDSGASVGVLRMLIAPVVAAVIFVCAEFSPDPKSRRTRKRRN